MSDYFEQVKINLLKEKYRIAMQIKDFEKAKKYFLEIKELEENLK